MSKKPAPKKKPGSQADGKRASLWKYSPNDLVIVGLDAVHNYDETHHCYDPESNAHNAEADEAMIANVRCYGVIEPVVIERDGPFNLVVDGRTRTRWARIAAAQQAKAGEVVLEVPCIVRAGDPAEMYGISRAANNGRRPDDSPIAKARQIQRMMDFGKSLEEAAIRQSIGVVEARKLQALLSLDPKVQRAVERGMAVSAAAPLAKLPRSEQVAKLAEIQATGEKPTARAVTNKLREGSGKTPVETPAQKLKRIAFAVAKLPPDERDAMRGDLEGLVVYIRDALGIAEKSNGAAQPAEQEAEFGA
jgi:ParB-like chromosome segregation protein Spo0J